MRGRRGAALLLAIAAMVWIGFLVGAATVCVIESIGRVEWELAELRSEAAMASGLAAAREVVGREGKAGGEFTVMLRDARAAVALEENKEGKSVLVTIRATGCGRNDVESHKVLDAEIPMSEGDRRKAEK